MFSILERRASFVDEKYLLSTRTMSLMTLYSVPVPGKEITLKRFDHESRSLPSGYRLSCCGLSRCLPRCRVVPKSRARARSKRQR